MTRPDVLGVLKTLGDFYSRDGVTPHALNDVQITLYVDALTEFEQGRVLDAARTWMRSSKWFPALSDLLGLLEPTLEPAVAAALAWASLEASIRSVGAYASPVLHADVGECVRQVFGSWHRACSFEFDSPGWTERRKLFMSIHPTIAQKTKGHPPIGLVGLHGDRPQLPAPVDGHVLDGEPSHQEATALIADVRSRFLALVKRR